MVVLSLTSLAFLAAAPAAVRAWPWGKSGSWPGAQSKTCAGRQSYINYTSVPGFFMQDDPSTNAGTFDYTAENFGLINRTYPTDGAADSCGDKSQWERFQYYVDTLNSQADNNTQYKVLFFGRHGEGWHNAAQTYYGTPAWNCYWSEQDGNATVTWLDAHLTDNGIAQAQKANQFWASQLATQQQQPPQSFYTSPLFRCLQTSNITYGNLPLPASNPFIPTIKEFLRETIDIHTCDERSNATFIHASFPSYLFEAGFTEKDELWNGVSNEPSAAQVQRSTILLDDIFSNDDNTWVSFTSHSGEGAATLTALNHIPFSLGTGALIPILVKAVLYHDQAFVPQNIPYTPSAVCNAPPITSLANCVCSSAPSSAVPTSPASITPAARLL